MGYLMPQILRVAVRRLNFEIEKQQESVDENKRDPQTSPFLSASKMLKKA